MGGAQCQKFAHAGPLSWYAGWRCGVVLGAEGDGRWGYGSRGRGCRAAGAGVVTRRGGGRSRTAPGGGSDDVMDGDGVPLWEKKQAWYRTDRNPKPQRFPTSPSTTASSSVFFFFFFFTNNNDDNDQKSGLPVEAIHWEMIGRRGEREAGRGGGGRDGTKLRQGQAEGPGRGQAGEGRDTVARAASAHSQDGGMEMTSPAR